MSEGASGRKAGRSHFLVLLGGETPAMPMAWVLLDAGAEEPAREGTAQPAEPPPATHPARPMLVIPGADALVRRLEMAARTQAQARAAAPYVFESALATGAGETHYAVGGAQDEPGGRLVAAIAASRLSEWLDACRALGAQPHCVWLDCTIWPVANGEIEVVETLRRTIVAGGRLGGYSMEPALAPSLFARWRAGLSESIAAVRIAGGGDAQRWRRHAGDDAPVLTSSRAGDPTLTLARAAIEAPEHAPNLLQGAFAPSLDQPSSWRIWRFAAILAVLALLLQVASLAAAGWRDQREATQTLAAAERDFRAARPEAPRIVNLRAQVAALANAMEQTEHHPVLAASEPVINALRAHPLVRLDEVRHAAPGRTVHLRFSAAQSPTLEALIGELRGQNLRFDVQSLAPLEGRYTVEVVLESP